MNKKIFLTSFVALGFACPAMAETFPVDGNMLENKTYDEAATYTNMGVYEGSVSANAYYDDIVYNIAAGNYLAAGSEATNGTQCPAGSWCPGISNINYSANTNQGLNACPNDYSNSVAGASANTQCYRTCSTDDVAHSASVTGQMYYDGTSGDGVNACEPATCVNGWHKKDGLNLATSVGNGAGISRAYIDYNNSFTEKNGNHGQSFYGISGANTWAVDYGNNGILVGQARCSTRGVTNIWYNNNNTFESDHFVSSLTEQPGSSNCYCNVTGYKASGSSALQSLSSPWVFTNTLYNRSDVLYCLKYCALSCSSAVFNTEPEYLAYRAALFGTITPTPASCEANTITITWSGASRSAIDANNAGTATYDGDIRTPQSAEHVPGKTFRGWKFVKPANNNNG